MTTWLCWLWGCGGATTPMDVAPEAPPGAEAPAPAVEGHRREHHDDATVTHRFDDPARWSAVFDDPSRDAWQKPAELIAALAIPPGAVVADIGAGTGYFEPHLAKAVGPEGKVIAVDVEPALVEHIRARAAKEGLTQVEARLGKPEDPALAAGEVDLVLLVDTYHHISDREAWFGRLQTAMKRTGRLVIVDFDPASDDDHGPPAEHRLASDVVLEELKAAGWSFIEQPDLLPHQYVLVVRPR